MIKEVTKSMMVSEMAENLIGSEIIRIAGEINDKIKKGEMIVIFNWFSEPLYDPAFNENLERICFEHGFDVNKFFVFTSANNIKNESKIQHISDHFFLKN